MKTLLWIFLLPFSLFAIDYQPWFPRPFEIQAEAKYLFQTFNDVNTQNGDLSYRARDNFATLNVGVAIFDNYDAQLEVQGAATKAHNFNFDHVSLTLQYLLWDDVIGDPLSWTVGVTGIQAVEQAVHDISSFHHGLAEGEIHTAIGKELTCGSSWSARGWIFGALGCADTGSPWTRANAAVEFQFPLRDHLFRFFVNSLWGMGHRNLVTLQHFHGYGPIKHQSVDVGFRYTYVFPYCGMASLEYARRIVAKNFPKQVDFLMLSYQLPIGL